MSFDQKLARPRDVGWKYQLRIRVIPFLARLGRLLRIPWAKLGKGLGREVLLTQATTLRNPTVIEPTKQPLDIVFLTMIGGHTHNTAVDAVLGLALRSRGHRVRMVVCDQQLPVCEPKRAGGEGRWSEVCGKCWAYGRKLFSSLGFEIVPVSTLAGAPQAEPAAWDEIIEAALLKHFRLGVLEDSQHVRERRAMFADAAAISAAVGRRLVEMRPDRVVMSHGIYCTWGPARAILNAASIPVITYSKCKKKHTEKFNWKTGADWWDVSVEWEYVKDTPLTEGQSRQIDAYLVSRRGHSQDTLVYNFGSEQTLEETQQRFALDPKKQTFVAFTNVLWDAASAQREIVFDDPIDWIMETIQWFSDHPEKQLVVKVHPAETVIGTNQPFASLIHERFSELPENVRVIEPHEKVNSWSIAQVADLGLAHTSTVGMELPLIGVPCAVVSRTHYRGRGFTIDVGSKEEYFSLLADWDGGQVDREQMQTLARRYAYLLFERYQLPFQVFHEPSHTDVRAFAFGSVHELRAHPTVRLFLEALEQRKDFLLSRALGLHGMPS